MIRQSRTWCGVAVVLGILAGCARQPGETATGKTTPASKAVAATNVLSSPDGSVRVTTQCQFDTVEKTIADAKGKVVLIDCWATWCGPCVTSFPKLVEKHQKYNGRGLAVISLSNDDAEDAGQVLAFLQKQNATFTNLHMPLDAAGYKGMQDKLGYRGGIPHAVLFDRTGKRVWTGHPMDPKLTALIEEELAKSGPAQG